MPLLSPSESYKFHSALLDYSNSLASEWSMYTSEIPSDSVEDNPPPPRERSDNLTKATKDLISLDANVVKWSEHTDRGFMSSALPAGAALSLHMPFRQSSAPSFSRSASSSLHSFASSSHPPFVSRPFVSHQQPPPLTVVPSLTVDSSAASDSQQSTSSISTDATPPPPTPPMLKRPYSSSTSDLSSLTDPSTSLAGPSSASGSCALQTPPKKPRTSSPRQLGPILNSKPTLLTPSQKKANHIQSEQKRRANIRKGYEALCETVPALREAIHVEEEALAAARTQGAEDGGDGKGKSKKKGRIRKMLGDTGEKMDGRAGPRSENIVLQKTIDYINDLLSEHAMLLNRLNYARSRLGPRDPALASLGDSEAPRLWEREWKGGLGIMDDSDAGDDGIGVGGSGGGDSSLADVDADAGADGATVDADSDDEAEDS